MIVIERKTKETEIKLEFEFYGSGNYEISTGVGFLDHMLESLCKHGLFDAKLECVGDIHVDFHHTVEDVGIVLGEAVAKSLFPISGIERFASASIVMDEALVSCDLDISGRPYLFVDLGDIRGKIGEFDAELAEEFFRAFALNAKISAHIVKQRGSNLHHIVEAAFKSLAVALRRGAAKNELVGVPSAKGVL
jgi:imidazoleglycerol-phosphate dehydratase